MTAIRLTNERGNEIQLSVRRLSDSVVVKATGPTSEVDNTWTLTEAIALRDLLIEATA